MMDDLQNKKDGSKTLSFFKKSIKCIIYISGLYLLRNFYNNYIDTTTYNNISFNEFEKTIREGINSVVELPLKKVEILSDKALIYDSKSDKANIVHRIFFHNLFSFEQKIDKLLPYTKITNVYHVKEFSLYNFIYNNIYYLILFYLLKNLLFDNKIYGDFFKNDAKLVKEKVNIKIKDVKGLFETKDEVLELVNIMLDYEKYTKLGTKIPSGILMEGPTGNGKTLLAKAIANNFNANFYYISGSSFIQTFVGLGTKKVKDLFIEARKNRPAIIFIDEIDTIGKTRSDRSNVNEERENTLNSLLVEMDGFESNKGILIIGATNRVEVLDKALLRPGRFDRIVKFTLPNKDERKDILNYYLENKPMDDNFKLNKDDNMDTLSVLTFGFSGAELYNLCNEASIKAGLENKETLSYENIKDAYEYILMGKEKKDTKLSIKEKRIVAHHEAGHALLSYKLKNVDNPTKVTIIPHSRGALGFSQSIPSKEKYLYTKNELLDQMKVLLGGRVAEDLVFNEITNGASDDISKLNKLAYQYVNYFGMDDEVRCFNTNENIKSDYASNKIDIAIDKLINELEKEVRIILTVNLERLKQIAKILIEKETINFEDIDKILKKNKSKYINFS